MRAHQLSQMIGPHLPETIVRLQAFSRHELLQTLWARIVPKSSLIFATKGVVRILCPEAVHILHKRGCALLADVVDLPSVDLPGPEVGIDCFVSPSLGGIARLQSHIDSRWGGGPKPLVAPVLHNADQRLYGRKIRTLNASRTVYWGDVRNCVKTSKIAQDVTFLDGANASGFVNTLEQILDYNVHYAVRPTDPEDWRIKPFTKGVNAAVLGAIVMADRAVPDAIDFLGSDYPFLIPSNSEAEVLDGLRHLRESFGGAEWQLAQSRCRDMAERVSPMALAAQITHIMKEIQG